MPERDIGGVKIYYTEQGSAAGGGGAQKPPLVLVHGFPLDARMWDAQVGALSQDRRVIVPDLPGFGRSKSDAPFTLASLADSLHALLSAVGAIPCVLAGLSMGGYMALAYVKKYAADLRGLILVDTKAEPDTAEGKQARDKMIDLARTEGAKAVADQMMPKMLAKDAPDQRPQVARQLRQIMESCPATTIAHALAAMRDRPDRSGELAAIKVPMLILVGDSDAITPPAVAQSMADKIPGAQLVTIRGAGHMSPMEQPEQVNRAIMSFLGRIE
jgi:pimeloyl-ACP methyl ester carboxylesterase